MILVDTSKRFQKLLSHLILFFDFYLAVLPAETSLFPFKIRYRDYGTLLVISLW